VNSNGFRIFSCSLLLLSTLTLACAGAAKAGSFKSGQFVTYLQPEWAGEGLLMGTPASRLLNADFSTVYAGSFGEVTMGSTYTMSFDSASAVEAYLPASGTPGPLNADLLDPTTSHSGSFGGDVVALTLDVNFSSAGFLTGSSHYSFGNLVMTGFPALPDLDGITVGQFLGQLDILLGGGSLPDGYTIAELDPIAIEVENSFTDGSPSTFAQTNLLPPTTAPTPEPSSLLLFGTSLLGLVPFRRKLFGR
jgi:hypothetical protein